MQNEIEEIIKGYLKFVVSCEENRLYVPNEYNEVTGELEGYAKTYATTAKIEMFDYTPNSQIQQSNEDYLDEFMVALLAEWVKSNGFEFVDSSVGKFVEQFKAKKGQSGGN